MNEAEKASRIADEEERDGRGLDDLLGVRKRSRKEVQARCEAKRDSVQVQKDEGRDGVCCV